MPATYFATMASLDDVNNYDQNHGFDYLDLRSKLSYELEHRRKGQSVERATAALLGSLNLADAAEAWLVNHLLQRHAITLRIGFHFGHQRAALTKAPRPPLNAA